MVGSFRPHEDSHLHKLLWQLGVVIGATVLAILIGVAFQWFRFNANIDPIDNSIFIPSGVSVEQFSYEEKLLILDSLSELGDKEVSTSGTQPDQNIIVKENILEEISSQDSGVSDMSTQEKLDILNRLQ